MTTTYTAQASRVHTVRGARRQVSSLPSVAPRSLNVAAFERPLKPEWARGVSPDRSNTSGVGRAMVPSRAQKRTRERIASPGSAVFDKSHRPILDRWADVAERFVTSRGGVSIALGSIILTLGLSPLVLADSPEQPAQPVTQQVVSEASGN